MKGKKSTYHQKKIQQIIDDLRLFYTKELQTCEIQGLGIHLDLLQKKWLEVHDQWGSAEDLKIDTNQVNK